SATSASRSARRTSRKASATSPSESAPRFVRRSRISPSRLVRLSNIVRLYGHSRLSLQPLPQDEANATPNAPEGATRCRALTSGRFSGRCDPGPVGHEEISSVVSRADEYAPGVGKSRICPGSVHLRRLGLLAREVEILAWGSPAKRAVGSVVVVEMGEGI